MPSLVLFGQQVRAYPFQARYLGNDEHQDRRPHGPHDRRGAVARHRGQQHADACDRDQRDQVARVRREHQQQAFRRRDDRAGVRAHAVEAPRGDAGAGGDPSGQEHGDRGVRHRRKRLGCEDLAAIDGPREDRLERAVSILGGDDVASHE